MEVNYLLLVFSVSLIIAAFRTLQQFTKQSSGLEGESYQSTVRKLSNLKPESQIQQSTYNFNSEKLDKIQHKLDKIGQAESENKDEIPPEIKTGTNTKTKPVKIVQ